MSNLYGADIVRTERLDLVYWPHMESREALTSDGRIIGLVRGILIDPRTWNIPELVVEVNKEILDELEIKGPQQSSLITIPTSFVKDISYMVQLKTDLASLRGAVSIYTIRLPKAQ